MSNDYNVGVPGIPLAAVDSIKDENTRIAMRAIVDGLHVRNGHSGNKDMAFITKAELKKLTGVQSSDNKKMIAAQVQDYFNQGGAISPSAISGIITDLQAQIMESKLFKDLGARIDLIDRPGGIFERISANELALRNETTQRIDGETGISTQITAMGTRIGDAEAAIKTETTQRVNADNALQTTISTQYAAVNSSLALQQQQITTNANSVSALSSSVTTLQSSVNGMSSSIQQEATTRANADKDLYAQYTLKVDVGGRISGFGLASTSTASQFIIRADRFSVASPSTADGVPVKIPFIVQTTTDTNGNPPGVYMDTAVIKLASISTAYIGAAAVDTLKIAGEAVTVNRAASWSPAYGGQTSGNVGSWIAPNYVTGDVQGWALQGTGSGPGNGSFNIGWKSPELIVSYSNNAVPSMVAITISVQAGCLTGSTNVVIGILRNGVPIVWRGNSTQGGFTEMHTITLVDPNPVSGQSRYQIGLANDHGSASNHWNPWYVSAVLMSAKR